MDRGNKKFTVDFAENGYIVTENVELYEDLPEHHGYVYQDRMLVYTTIEEVMDEMREYFEEF